jgi:hypothetical protein
MWEYFADFCSLMNIKKHPSDYEKHLFEKTQRYARYISWIPGLKMVAVCNSLSMYATKSWESDIDLFIVTAPKRLWSVRIMVTVIFQLLWVRRNGKKIKERFCLSFFITDKALDFSSFAIQNDIYLFYWIYFLKPIISKDGTYERFLRANKPLGINEINLNWDNKAYLLKTSKYRKIFDRCRLLDFKNYILKLIFLPRTIAHKKRLWNPWGLIVTDDILKFTDNDKRVEIRDRLI